MLASVPLLLLCSQLTQGCQGDGFECGRYVPGTDTVRRCDRSLEICVCATNSCARQVSPGDEQTGNAGDSQGGAGEKEPAGTCKSGYRYVEAPFAKRALAGQCVPPLDLALVAPIKNDAPVGTVCAGVEVQSGVAGGGGTGASPGAGGTSGGTMSEGGTSAGESNAASGGMSEAGGTLSGAGGSAPNAGASGAPDNVAGGGGESGAAAGQASMTAGAGS